MDEQLKRKAQKLLDNKGNQFLTQLEATLDVVDSLKEVTEAIKSIPETIIPEYPEIVIPEQKEVVFPDIQKVELINPPKEKDDKEVQKLLKELVAEVKKKEQYAYDIEIDSALKEQLRGEKGDKGEDSKNGNEIEAVEIANKLETLEGGERLDVSAVKGTEELIEDIATKIAKGEVKKVKKQSTDKLNSPSHSLSHRVFANDNAAPAQAIVVNSAGRVGIGTTSPEGNLTVYNPSGQGLVTIAGSVNGGFLRVSQGTNVATGTIDLGKINSPTNGLGLSRSGGDGFLYYDTGNGDIVMNNTFGGSSLLNFMYGGSSKMVINSSGNVGIGTTSPTAKLDVNSDIIRLRTAKTPASAGAAGNAGDICWDASYVYVCVATNTWKRSAIATW